MEELTTNLLQSGAVILIAIIVRVIAMFAIRRVQTLILAKPPQPLGKLGKRITGENPNLRHEQRVRTLSSLLRNVVDIAIVVITLFTVLAIFDIPMGPLLASAGVGGVALGFGAQSLVKDYISGIFMLAEDQFGVGDIIIVGELTGTVEEVTLRVTKVREMGGTLWYIRNGEVLTLGNISQGSSATVFDIHVAADEDADRAIAVLREAVEGMHEEPEFEGVILEPVSVLGVGGVDASKLTLQAWLRAAPYKHWGPMREVRQRAQEAFAREGIRGPILPGVVSSEEGP